MSRVVYKHSKDVPCLSFVGVACIYVQYLGLFLCACVVGKRHVIVYKHTMYLER